MIICDQRQNKENCVYIILDNTIRIA